MTTKETRQLGIEVERRLQTILPIFKIENKIDTEDIYAFLNQFQKQYIDAIYRQDDQVESGTRVSVLGEDILRTLTKHGVLSSGIMDTTLDYKNKVFTLPSDYYQYIRSVSSVTGSYKDTDQGIVSNVLLKQSDINKIINQNYDKHRILRNPIAALEGNKLKIIHDDYTSINYVDVTYIKIPANFSVTIACELPYECFEDLVAGATDLYVRHLTATQPKQQKKETE